MMWVSKVFDTCIIKYHQIERRKIIVYREVKTDMKFVDREKATLKFWNDNKIFEKSIESRKDAPTSYC